jgi:hypothetical protein
MRRSVDAIVLATVGHQADEQASSGSVTRTRAAFCFGDVSS